LSTDYRNYYILGQTVSQSVSRQSSVSTYNTKGKKVKVVNLYSASSRACARL